MINNETALTAPTGFTIIAATVAKTYQANITFEAGVKFLPDERADNAFKLAFAESLLVAKTHEAHWIDVREVVKAYASRELCQDLPSIGYWTKGFKHAFRGILEAIDAQANA
jgi:hypothetical protein